MNAARNQDPRVAAAAPGGGASESGVAIRVRGLSKRYGDVEAVRGIDLTVRTGEIFAFLGPNGAGKTTTVETLEGYRHRDAGEAEVLGSDPARPAAGWRARIGVVLQESQPEAELTVEECVSLYAGYYPRPRPVGETLELVGLADRRAARCGQLSGGQRRRLDVALALIGDPELVFLDEPTTGFDPAARQSAWQVIAGLRDLGKTIFLTTHYMEEAEHLADRIAVIAAGRIVAEGTPATLGGRDTGASVITFTLPSGLSAADLPPAVAVVVTGSTGGKVEAHATSPLPVLGALAAWAQARGADLPDLQVIRPTAASAEKSGSDNSVLKTVVFVVALALTGAAAFAFRGKLFNFGSAWQAGDIGEVGAAGSFSQANGGFTVNGSGADTWHRADGFYYVFQPLNGDGALTAHVLNIKNTDVWAKAGVMIRETTEASSMFAEATIRPDGQAQFVWRNATGGEAASSQLAGGMGYPKWVKIVRSGNRFSAFYRVKAVDEWQPIGEVQTISMTSATQIGLVVCAHKAGTLCEAQRSLRARSESAVRPAFACGPPSGVSLSVRVDPAGRRRAG